MSEQITVDGVRIDIERGEAGLYYGTSKDVQGLLITGKTIDAMIEEAPRALDELKRAKLTDSEMLDD
jgi:hypothetical protein